MRASIPKWAGPVSEDQAFDPTVERRCDRVGCEQRACFRPVLLLRPSRVYVGRPVRFLLGVVVCEAHKEKLVDAYLTDDLWGDIVGDFKKRGASPPHRASTRLDFDAHHGERAESVALASALIEQLQDPVERVKEVLRRFVGRSLTDAEVEMREELRAALVGFGVDQARQKMLALGFRDEQFVIVNESSSELLDQGRFRCRVKMLSGVVGTEDVDRVRAAGLVPIAEDGATN